MSNCLPITVSTVVLYLALFNLFETIDGNKYDKSNNIPQSGEERKFRSGRVHQMWEKAIRMELPALTMTDLYADLKHLDRLLMEQKKLKADGRDADGMKEAELTEKFHNTISKYGLGGKREKNSGYPKQKKKEIHRLSDDFLKDPKLENLWRLAKNQGRFTEDELEKLETEFMHHKRKLEEYEMIRAETAKVHDLSDNSVEKQLIMEDNKKKRTEMREMQEEIDEGYKRLHLKTKQATVDAGSVPFTEPRVADLWELAKNGNFTEEELESIKEELEHFQIRVEKHLYFRDQLKNSAEKVDYHGGKDKIPSDRLKTHEHLQNKVQNLAAKVKKLHHDLSSKLSSGIQTHREL